MQWIYLTKWENPTATLSPKGTHTGSEPVCPEQGSTGYAVAPLHLLTGMSQHREEMKTRVWPDPTPAPVVLPEPALTAQDLPSLIVWQQPTNQMRESSGPDTCYIN